MPIFKEIAFCDPSQTKCNLIHLALPFLWHPGRPFWHLGNNQEGIRNSNTLTEHDFCRCWVDFRLSFCATVGANKHRVLASFPFVLCIDLGIWICAPGAPKTSIWPQNVAKIDFARNQHSGGWGVESACFANAWVTKHSLFWSCFVHLLPRPFLAVHVIIHCQRAGLGRMALYVPFWRCMLFSAIGYQPFWQCMSTFWRWIRPFSGEFPRVVNSLPPGGVGCTLGCKYGKKCTNCAHSTRLPCSWEPKNGAIY